MIWVLSALAFGLSCAWALLVPALRGPDELNHVDAVLAVRDEIEYPAFDSRTVDPGLRAAMLEFHFERGSAHLTAAEAPPRQVRPTVAQLAPRGSDLDLSLIGRPGTQNHITQHPPAYYLLLGTSSPIAAVSTDRLDLQLGMMRLVSALTAAWLPLLAWLTARQIGSDDREAVTAAFMVLAVPQLSHIGGTVNSDPAVASLIAVTTLFALRVQQSGARCDAMAAGLALSAALLTKGLALALIPVPLVAVATASVDGPSTLRARARLAAVTGGVSMVGVSWWLTNLFRFGSLAPSIEYSTRFGAPPSDFRPSLLTWAESWIPMTTRTFWGAFGLVDTYMPHRVVLSATAVAIGAVVLSVAQRLRRDRIQTVVLLAPVVLLAAFIAANSLRLYWGSGIVSMAQGRYLFGAVPALAALAASWWAKAARAASVVSVAFLAGALQVIGALAAVDHFWGPDGADLTERMRAISAWSPWPPPITAAMLALPVALAGLATYCAIARCRPDSAGSVHGHTSAAHRDERTEARLSE